ncbi:L-rhamnose-binding lectin ELEL-1-like [Rhopilema esculentum]|uniref:L-rhamnose-binding lectin ELEL-1-like n=1 Tax=Rhopilema esculentum TaxID=499914 RepID=UPI0031D8F093|eukprot:gene9246-16933_t
MNRFWAFLALVSAVFAIAKGGYMYICENQDSTISCPSNLKVRIDFAYYGRLHQRNCTTGPMKTVECRAESSEKIVKNLCNNQQSCTLKANNKVFGDPCVGTFKYLHVKYCCS